MWRLSPFFCFFTSLHDPDLTILLIRVFDGKKHEQRRVYSASSQLGNFLEAVL